MSLFDIFSTRAADQAAADRKTGFTNAYDASSNLFGLGRDTASTQYGNAVAPYQGLLDQGNRSSMGYADALGLNGPQGNQNAVNQFQAGPGFNFALNTGLDAIDRRSASKGMLNSGNNTTDTLNFANGLANQNWQQHMQNFAPLMGQQLVGAKGLGDTYAHLGNTLDTSYKAQAGDAYKTQQGIGDAQAAASLDANRASGQTWGALMAGANMGSKLLGFGM